VKILVFDAETSLHNVGETAVGKFKADPYHPDNWIVWLGMKWLRDDLTTRKATKLYRFEDKNSVAIPAPRVTDEGLLLVGHNVKFDIQYLCGPNNALAAQWRAIMDDPRVKLWDTQVAEFRLRGQSVISPSMDWCCEQRGWETKPGRLKEYWENGVSTEDIPDSEVEPYLTHDIDTTSKLFVYQVHWALERGLMPLMRLEMDAVATTTVMEINGMAFDKAGAVAVLDEELQPVIDALLDEIRKPLAEEIGAPEDVINPGSNPFLNAYFYGGTWKYKVQEFMYEDDGTPILFKSGKKKGQHRKRWTEYEVELPRRVPAKCKLTSVDDETLVKLKPQLADKDKPFIEQLRKLRRLTKEAKTYFRGYSALTYPDGLIHGNLNHAIVATARLSASAPNLQNAAHGRIRQHFLSRYEGGHLLEVDLSQIEVVVQAFLSQDEHLISDIVAGVDFHSKRAAAAAGVEYDVVREAYLAEDEYWTKKRKNAKQFSFQRAYGAGAPAIAVSTGMDLGDVEELIRAEEAMYPGVVDYQNDCIKAVNRSTAERDGIVCGSLTTQFGSEYRFQREKYRGELGYKPTTVKNYPVQGMAGDIIKLILGSLRKFLYDYNAEALAGSEPVLMIMTVHDSVIFDVPSWVDMKDLATKLIALFVGVRDTIKQRFGFEFNVPIKADAEYGVDWYKMTKAA
jgi:DNA polymerase I-like protein with 3'-5' exonuclease and polymerase domains